MKKRRTINSHRTAEAIKEPGLHACSMVSGLYLRIRKSGTKHWVQRIQVRGKRTDLGLGALDVVTLDEAREQAIGNRRSARQDRLADRDNLLARGKQAPTFAKALAQFVREQGWKDEKAKQWASPLEMYAVPILGSIPVNAVQAQDIVKALMPIWVDKNPTARIVRQRIAMLFSWCEARGHLDRNVAGPSIVAALPRVRKANGHHESLPHAQVPAALQALEASGDSATRKCLAFIVLTAVRPSEARGALWSEIDLDKRLWHIPAERMKARIAHTVPLSEQAVRVLAQARRHKDGSGLVFPSPVTRGNPVSGVALPKVLKTKSTEAARACTVHGFRSSFRDWCADTGQPRELAEMCLAHAVGNATEQAYLRTSMLERRRAVMGAWGAYATTG